ncbi:MAG TPA: heme-binding domain-containing protein [Opitutaceae bacterium]|nr:heme-binding domain-containing protein [Opitutaceae bacterium]
MRRYLRLRLLAPAAAVFVAGLQFIRPARNLGAAEGPQDLSHRYPVPADVHRLLVAACYDCHSNHTHYPWYANVQPVGWWLANHVRSGKGHLNFSDFGAYGPHQAARKLDVLADQVDEGKMPLPSYRWMHPAARLTEAERAKIVDWAQDLHDKLAPE